MIPDRISDAGVVAISAVAPKASFNGVLWYDTTARVLKVFNNGVWGAVGTGGGGAGAPEVHVGASAPTGSELIWVNNSDPTYTVLMVKDGPSWAVVGDAGRY